MKTTALLLLLFIVGCTTTESPAYQTTLMVEYLNGDIDTMVVNYYSSHGEAHFQIYQDRRTCPQPSLVVPSLPLAPPHIIASYVRNFDILETKEIDKDGIVQ